MHVHRHLARKKEYNWEKIVEDASSVRVFFFLVLFHFIIFFFIKECGFVCLVGPRVCVYVWVDGWIYISVL